MTGLLLALLIVAVGAGGALAERLRRSTRRARAAEAEVARLREANGTSSGDGQRSESGPGAADHAALDPATGLYEEHVFTVLVQQQVAAARRSLRPVSVVLFEVDRLGDADEHARMQALTLVGDVVRRTLRESDAACRLSGGLIGAVLEDTPETGAVWAAERVRGTLLTSPVGTSLTLSAGVACYPSHALSAAELVTRAGAALDAARTGGRDRVELAPEA